MADDVDPPQRTEPDESGHAPPDDHGALADHGEEIVATRAADRFRRNTVGGAILSGVAIALRDILDPKVKEEAPVIQEAPGDPPGDRPVDVHLDPDDPTASSVLVRPHLIDDPDAPTHPPQE